MSGQIAAGALAGGHTAVAEEFANRAADLIKAARTDDQKCLLAAAYLESIAYGPQALLPQETIRLRVR